VAGELQAGFVSAVDGVTGLAAGEAVLAFDRVSGSVGAERANPGRADSALADPALVAPVPPNLELPDTVLPDATTGSGAEAPSGLAGTSGWPFPLDSDSSGGGIAALGMVASERLLPCAMVTADESSSASADPTVDDALGPGQELDPDDALGPDDEPGPNGASDSGGESAAVPTPFFAWTAVVAVEDVREERGAVSELLALVVLAPESPGTFAPVSPVS
jgi:hypothetical protein